MKRIISIIFILMITQCMYASEYPPSKDIIINELGEEYYSLRKELPYDDAGLIFIDEALIKREQNIDILYRLLNDKDITTKQKSLFETVDINSSDFIFKECRSILYALIKLIIIEGDYQYLPQAVGDNFKNLNEKDQKTINSMLKQRYTFYSILYQKKSNMPKDCADILAQYVFESSHYSHELNKRKLIALKQSIENGCIYIGILSHYADALIKEGEYKKNDIDAEKQIITLYYDYFERLSEYDLNSPTVLEFLRRISSIKNSEGKFEGEFDINKKIVKYISLNKIKLEEQPQWVRRGYLKLLSKSVRSKDKKHRAEITRELQKVFKEKGNIFVLENEKLSSKLSQEEKQFLRSIQQAN